MFLETESSFPYCNWSTKMAWIIWLGSTSVQHVNNWQRLSRLPFLSLCKSMKFLEIKTYSFISIKKKIICKTKIPKKLAEIWFASVFAASSAASCSPLCNNNKNVCHSFQNKLCPYLVNNNYNKTINPHFLD